MVEAPNFIPLPENIDEPPTMRDECRELPPPADEAGFAETHEAEGVFPEDHEPAGPSMDIDMIDENHKDLTKLNVCTHDRCEEGDHRDERGDLQCGAGARREQHPV